MSGGKNLPQLVRSLDHVAAIARWRGVFPTVPHDACYALSAIDHR
jgi:hypothetical protein